MKSLAKEVAAMVSEAEEMDASEEAVSDDIQDDGLPSELRHRGDRWRGCSVVLRGFSVKPMRRRCFSNKSWTRGGGASCHRQSQARAQAEVCCSGSQRGGQSQPNRSGQPGDEEFQGVGSGLQCSSVVTRDQIIVAPDVTSQANDVQQLQPMLDKANTVVRTVLGETACLGTVLNGRGLLVGGQRSIGDGGL